jgi:chromosome segregation ATPase
MSELAEAERENVSLTRELRQARKQQDASARELETLKRRLAEANSDGDCAWMEVDRLRAEYGLPTAEERAA